MKTAPLYNLHTRRLHSADPHRIVYRPSLRTAILRLPITFSFFVLAGIIWFGSAGFRQAPDPRSPISETERAEIAKGEQELLEHIRREMNNEEYEKLAATANARRAEHEAALVQAIENRNRVAGMVTQTVYGMCAALIVLSILPIVSCLWERVSIEKDANGAICIFQWRFVPRRRRWAPAEFSRIDTWAMERYWFRRYGRVTKHSWDWFIQLAPLGPASMPIVADAALTAEAVGPQFLIHRQKEQPTGIGRAPEPVRDFVKALRALTGLPADPPKTVQAQLIHGWLGSRVRRQHSQAITSTPHESVETHTFRSLDEVPPELRERMADLLRGGNVTQHPDGSIEATGERVERRVLDGKNEIHDNWESIPPEVREQVKRLRGKRG